MSLAAVTAATRAHAAEVHALVDATRRASTSIAELGRERGRHILILLADRSVAEIILDDIRRGLIPASLGRLESNNSGVIYATAPGGFFVAHGSGWATMVRELFESIGK